MKIHATVTKKEYEAIKEYAKMCDESISDLLRKTIIQEITLMRSAVKNIPTKYAYYMLIPADAPDDNGIVEENYNKIREIIGLEKITLS